MKVVIDSSVWISAFQFGGTPERAVRRAGLSDQIVTCEHIHEEVRRHLTGKFKWDPERLEVTLRSAWKDALWVTTTGALTGICRDPGDDAILECAVLGDATLIVSGDSDLLELRHYGKIRILTAREYLERADAAAT